MSLIEPLYMYRIAIAWAILMKSGFIFISFTLSYVMNWPDNGFVRFKNDWIEKVPLPAKLDSANCLVQYLVSSIFFLSNNYQNGLNVAVLA